MSPPQHPATAAPSSNNDGAKTTVIFLHIPKTAGTTMSRIVERQYPRRDTFTIMEEAGPYSGPLQDLEYLPPERRPALELVKGHAAFGVHDVMPDPHAYFTLLREPAPRVLSHYAHARRDPRHNLHPFMRRMTLEEALAQGTHAALAFDNFQTRLISGVWNAVPFGLLDESVLQRAKDNLRRHNRLDGALYRFASRRLAEQLAQAGRPFQRRLRRFQVLNRIVGPGLRLYWRARAAYPCARRSASFESRLNSRRWYHLRMN